MAGRRFPWDLRQVPWSDLPEFTRGRLDGIVLLSWGIGPRDKLATRQHRGQPPQPRGLLAGQIRQLRGMGLRPGGQDPVALLYFRCRKACKFVIAELFLIDKALPVRPMTPARQAALDKALAARRTCRQCGETGYAELPKAHRTCEPCRYTLGMLDGTDYLHDYLTGTPTVEPAEHAALAESGRWARVIPLHPAGGHRAAGLVRGVA